MITSIAASLTGY